MPYTERTVLPATLRFGERVDHQPEKMSDDWDQTIVEFARVGQNMDAEAQVELVFDEESRTKFVALKTLTPEQVLLATTGQDAQGHEKSKSRISEWRENYGRSLSAAKAIDQVLEAHNVQQPDAANSSLVQLLTKAKLILEEPISYLRTRRGSVHVTEASGTRRSTTPTGRRSDNGNGMKEPLSSRKNKRRKSLTLDLQGSEKSESEGDSRHEKRRSSLDDDGERDGKRRMGYGSGGEVHSAVSQSESDSDGRHIRKRKRNTSSSSLHRKGDAVTPIVAQGNHVERRRPPTPTSAPPFLADTQMRIPDSEDRTVNSGVWRGPRIRFGSGKRKTAPMEESSALTPPLLKRSDGYLTSDDDLVSGIQSNEKTSGEFTEIERYLSKGVTHGMKRSGSSDRSTGSSSAQRGLLGSSPSITAEISQDSGFSAIVNPVSNDINRAYIRFMEDVEVVAIHKKLRDVIRRLVGRALAGPRAAGSSSPTVNGIQSAGVNTMDQRQPGSATAGGIYGITGLQPIGPSLPAIGAEHATSHATSNSDSLDFTQEEEESTRLVRALSEACRQAFGVRIRQQTARG